MSLKGSAEAAGVLRGKLRDILVIDDTLTQEGACADAKAAGDALRELEEKLTDALNGHSHDVIDLGGIKIKLVWENKSKSSTFPEQTIEANLSTGLWAVIVFRPVAAASRYKFEFAQVGVGLDAVGTRVVSGVPNFTTRPVTVNKQSVVFGSGSRWAIGASSVTAADDHMVPCYIFVIEGVQE